jgi:hypothetical protein
LGLRWAVDDGQWTMVESEEKRRRGKEEKRRR